MTIMPKCHHCRIEHSKLKQLNISPLTLVALESDPVPGFVNSVMRLELVCPECYQAEQERRWKRYRELISLNPSTARWRSEALGFGKL